MVRVGSKDFAEHVQAESELRPRSAVRLPQTDNHTMGYIGCNYPSKTFRRIGKSIC